MPTLPTLSPSAAETVKVAQSKSAHLLTTVGDAFGTAVAISADGRTLAISAPGEDSEARGVDGDEFNNKAINSGAVYVYFNTGSRWVRQAYLKAKDSQLEDLFGSALSLSADGSVLAIGASQTDGMDEQLPIGAGVNQGAVYLFRRKQQHWYQEAQLQASNAESFDAFGSVLTVSADGQTLAVAALGEDGSGDSATGDDNQRHNAGAVYLFQYQNDQWQQRTILKGAPAQEMEDFGHALSISEHGKLLAIGANQHDGFVTENGVTKRLRNAGMVYLFAQQTDGWQLQSKLSARYADERDNFGTAVSLNADGTRLAISAQGEAGSPGAGGDGQDNSATNAGAVYLYELRNGQWQQQAYLKAANGEKNDGFGTQLQFSANGKVLAVSAQWEDSSGNADNNNALQSGAVYVFNQLKENWKQTAYLKAEAPAALDQFGSALSLSADGNILVIGAAAEDAGLLETAPGYHPGVALSSGAVYLFHKPVEQWQQGAYFKATMDSDLGDSAMAAYH
ncbi:hypothetical protein ABMA57_14920 [Saccharospirillum sp. HFRX-1]|uniref:hypothetical protein n=1 Tax=unclassified Saccharospirillum TaxID=2633430 RepID=UPI003718470F